jgi:hypothetical protein
VLTHTNPQFANKRFKAQFQPSKTPGRAEWRCRREAVDINRTPTQQEQKIKGSRDEADLRRYETSPSVARTQAVDNLSEAPHPNQRDPWEKLPSTTVRSASTRKPRQRSDARAANVHVSGSAETRSRFCVTSPTERTRRCAGKSCYLDGRKPRDAISCLILRRRVHQLA